MFADAAGEHQGVKAAERGRECTEPLGCLVTKHRDGKSTSRIGVFARQEIPHVGARFRDAQESGSTGEQIVQLLSRKSLGAGKVSHDTGIEVAGTRAHDQPAGRREPHARVNTASFVNCGEARAVAQMREDDAAA